MPEGRGEATPGHGLEGDREAAIRRLGRTTRLPAARRLLLVEELAGDVEGLAARLEAQGRSPAEARLRALELLAPSPEAVHDLERLHGNRRGREDVDTPEGSDGAHSAQREAPSRRNRAIRTRLPARDQALPQGLLAIVPALVVGALLPWALPAGTRAAAVPMALAAGIALVAAPALIRQGWGSPGEDLQGWRRSLRLHLASLVVVWAGTLLGGAQVVHRWMVPLAGPAPGLEGGLPVGGLTALLHPLLILCVLATALTLAAVVHLTLLVPRVSGSVRARDAVEELIQILLGRSR